MSAAPAESDGPVVASAVLGPGHDGRAEIVIELAYPNGGRTTLSLPQEAVGRIVDAAALTTVDELVGQSWATLAAGLPFMHTHQA